MQWGTPEAASAGQPDPRSNVIHRLSANPASALAAPHVASGLEERFGEPHAATIGNAPNAQS